MSGFRGYLARLGRAARTARTELSAEAEWREHVTENEVRAFEEYAYRLYHPASLADRYVEGRVCLHVHMRIGTDIRDADLYDVCLAFVVVAAVDDLHVAELQGRARTERECWEQGSVLVGVPPTVEHPEQFAVPSLIRLAPFDNGQECARSVEQWAMILSSPLRGGRPGKKVGLRSFAQEREVVEAVGGAISPFDQGREQRSRRADVIAARASAPSSLQEDVREVVREREARWRAT